MSAQAPSTDQQLASLAAELTQVLELVPALTARVAELEHQPPGDYIAANKPGGGGGGAPTGPAGGSLAGEYPNPEFAGESVLTATIKNLAVTEPKIAAEAVTEGKIANLAVGTGKIANGAVTEGKIAAEAVSEGKLAAAVVAKLVKIGGMGAYEAREANKEFAVPAEPTQVYLTVSTKAEKTAFEILVDGVAVYKFPEITPIGGASNIYFDFVLKAGGKWEVKVSVGALKEMHSVYQGI